ncbi:YolD-like family protein [Collinsella provencensis]|uniref:YolD-like family protein n=1 Tax=Collinsella provencensis TaxID=1937461 RepID=UPI001F26A9FC|nr:YolD-like family protein [Collinsella provencensis]
MPRDYFDTALHDQSTNRLTANGQPRASRAAQFMPFAALTGYYELARQQERVTEPRHELTEEEALALSRTITQVKRGDMIRVTYYDWDAYRTASGMVARIDTTLRRLQIVKTVIPFDDIRSIERDAQIEEG